MRISKEDIINAHDRIKPYIHRTPVMTNQSINEMTGIDFYFKCENFQKIGAFKIRGGMNATLTLSADQLKNGIATHLPFCFRETACKSANTGNKGVFGAWMLAK